MSAPTSIQALGADVRRGERAPVLAMGRLTVTEVVRYAGVSGDLNPVHHDPDLARSLGHPGIFVMGMLPGAILGAFATRWLAPPPITSLDLRFIDRVWPHEQLECGGEVVEVASEGDYREVTAKLWVRSTDDVLKVHGGCVASIAAPDPR